MKDTVTIEVQSSVMKQISYAKSTQELMILFNNDERYIYPNISAETFEKFVASESKGKFFNRFIKEGGNPEENVEEVDNSTSNKHALSFLTTSEDETISRMVKTYDYRAKSGRLLFTVYGEILGWVAGAEIDGEIQETDGARILTIDFSFPKEQLFGYIPQAEAIIEDFVQVFNANSSHPLGKMLGLNLNSLAQAINDCAGSEIFYFPEWLLTDLGAEGLLDMEKVHAYDKSSTERDLRGFIANYRAKFEENRQAADGETMEWCDVLSQEDIWS